MTVMVWDGDNEFDRALDIQDDFEQDFGADDWSDPRYGHVSGTTRPSISYVNEAGIPEDVMDRHFRRGRGAREIASVIEKWTQQLNNESSRQRTLDLFNRGKGFEGAVHPFATMARTAWAVENDDILSTLADVVEGLMWAKCRFELIDEDQQSLWNQWAKDVNLDRQLRKMSREIFKTSQVYVGLWWAKKVYKVDDDKIREQIEDFERERKQLEYERQVEEREALIAANKGNPEFITPPELPEPPDNGPGKGNRRRRKTFPVEIPIAMNVFDPTKVLPVGSLLFNRERYAYIATRDEDDAFSKVLNGEVADDTVLQMIERKYVPTEEDKQACADIGLDHTRLWLFRKDAIFRHTVTRADYERFAMPRLKPVLPLIEMKEHLRASDRASLIGNTNFIVVITKGSDKHPAKPSEVANLQEQAKVIARLPVLVGDHRLHVEIVSPAMDNTLIDSRWQTLDARLVFKALRSFAPVTQGGAGGGGAGVKEMSRVVSKGLENDRHMQLRTIESEVFAKVIERNEGVLEEFPNLEFTPKRISLEFSAEIVTSILKLRDRGDISRETTLEELDFDQDLEVLRRGKERVLYDQIFESQTPFSSPQQNPYGGGQPNIPPQQQPNFNGNAPASKGNVGPNGQPRTEGGRPPGKTETKPRKTAAAKG